MQDLRQIAATADVLVTVGDMGLRPSRGQWLCTDSPDELAAWARGAFSLYSQRVALMMPEPWVEAHPERAQAMTEALELAQHNAATTQHTMIETTVQHAEYFIKNLPRIERAPWATGIGRPLEGRTAIIASAGPSLDRNKHLLQRAQEMGCAVIAANTAASALPACPDVIVSLESKDLSTHFRKWAGQSVHALDLCANPSAWDAPSAGQLAIGTHNSAFSSYVTQTGGVPMPGGAGVASMAVGLALWWGAERIALVGQDLSWPGGKCYAEGTEFDDLRADVSGDNIKQSAGTSKELHDSPSIRVPAWGGGEVVTNAVLHSYIQWFQQTAAAHPGRIINATEGGAHIEGAAEWRLADVLQTVTPRERVDFRTLASGGTSAWRGVYDRLRAEALRMRDANDDELPEATRLCPMAKQWTTATVYRMIATSGLSAEDRMTRVTDGHRQAASRVLELVGG